MDRPEIMHSTVESSTVFIHLQVSLLDNGINSPVAVLLYEALKEYSEGLLDNVIWAVRDGDDASAVVFLNDHQDVAELMRILQSEVVKVANRNEEYSQKLHNNKVINKEYALDSATKEFKKKYRRS